MEKPTNNINETAVNNNSIGSLLSTSRDIPTSSDKVYRGINGQSAVDDIFESGIVRNKQSAGLVEKSRWGPRVFYSKGEEGKYHPVEQGRYIIEAPYDVAKERAVTHEDLTAIYTKNEQGGVIDVLSQEREKRLVKQKAVDEEKINEVKKSLGIAE